MRPVPVPIAAATSGLTAFRPAILHPRRTVTGLLFEVPLPGRLGIRVNHNPVDLDGALHGELELHEVALLGVVDVAATAPNQDLEEGALELRRGRHVELVGARLDFGRAEVVVPGDRELAVPGRAARVLAELAVDLDVSDLLPLVRPGQGQPFRL